MIFDEAGEQQKPPRHSIDSPEQARTEIYGLLEHAQTLGIQMSFHRNIVDGEWEEYLEWQVLQGREHEPAIRWMYRDDNYRKLYYWYKMLWHRLQELHEPYESEEIEETA